MTTLLLTGLAQMTKLAEDAIAATLGVQEGARLATPNRMACRACTRQLRRAWCRSCGRRWRRCCLPLQAAAKHAAWSSKRQRELEKCRSKLCIWTESSNLYNGCSLARSLACCHVTVVAVVPRRSVYLASLAHKRTSDITDTGLRREALLVQESM